MGILSELNGTGDTKTIWDPNKPDEVEVARSAFDSLKKKGYVAYRVDKAGDKGEVMRSFDPAAGMVIMVPPVVGG